MATGDRERVELSFINRLSKLKPVDQCPWNAFRIETVLDENGLQAVAWADILEATDEGTVVIKDTTTVVTEWNVYISALIGNTWYTFDAFPILSLTIQQGKVSLPNVAPRFVEEPALVVSLHLEAEDSYSLPEVFDANFDKYEVSLNSDVDFLSLNPSTNQIIVDSSKVSTDLNVTAIIILTDANGAQTEYTIHLEIEADMTRNSSSSE